MNHFDDRDDVDPRSIDMPGNQALWEGLRSNDLMAIRRALKSGAAHNADSPDWVPGKQVPPLTYAIRKGMTECALELVEAGASGGCWNRREVPWVECVLQDNPQVFEALAERERGMVFGDAVLALRAALGVPWVSSNIVQHCPVSYDWVERLSGYHEGKHAWSQNIFSDVLRALAAVHPPLDDFDEQGRELARSLELLGSRRIVGRFSPLKQGATYWDELAVRFSSGCVLTHPEVVRALSGMLPMESLHKQSPKALADYHGWLSALENAEMERDVAPVTGSHRRGPGRL